MMNGPVCPSCGKHLRFPQGQEDTDPGIGDILVCTNCGESHRRSAAARSRVSANSVRDMVGHV